MAMTLSTHMAFSLRDARSLHVAYLWLARSENMSRCIYPSKHKDVVFMRLAASDYLFIY